MGLELPMNEKILPCPFCGASASVEEVSSSPGYIFYSVGCDGEVDCMGYQSLTTFATKHEAIVAWNKRVPIPVFPMEYAPELTDPDKGGKDAVQSEMEKDDKT
jgi:hypothetical protein